MQTLAPLATALLAAALVLLCGEAALGGAVWALSGSYDLPRSFHYALQALAAVIVLAATLWCFRSAYRSERLLAAGRDPSFPEE